MGMVGRLRDDQIAEALGLKKPTVRTYCRSLYRKLGLKVGRGASGRAAAVSVVTDIVLELWKEGVKWPAPKETSERPSPSQPPRKRD